jgi:hypothetical protein
LAGLTILVTGTTLAAQISGDVIGVHNLGPGSTSPITGARTDFCAYCHAPHSGLNTGLWNQKLTTQVYTVYSSDTELNRDRQPVLGADSNQCLSCHDGTVAVGTTVVYGNVTTRGSMNAWDVFGSNLQSSHPFSMVRPLKDNIDLAASLAGTGKTADPTGAVKLIRGDVECTSCHNPHIAELSGEGQLERPDVHGLPRSDAHVRHPGQPPGGLGHQRPCPIDRQDFHGGRSGQLHHGGHRCLHLLPHAAQRQRGGAAAAGRERTGLHCLPQRRHERLSHGGLRGRIS